MIPENLFAVFAKLLNFLISVRGLNVSAIVGLFVVLFLWISQVFETIKSRMFGGFWHEFFSVYDSMSSRNK